MDRQYSLPVILALLGSACAARDTQTSHAQVPPSEGSWPSTVGSYNIEKCTVMKAVALELCKIANSGKDEVIASETISTRYPLQVIADDRKNLGKYFPSQTQLVDRLVELSRVQGRHSCTPSVSLVEFIQPEQVREIKRDAGKWWNHFESLHPKSCGLGRFSDVAFSSDGQWALLYAEIQYGDLAAAGSYWLMRKDKGIWVQGERRDVWTW